MKNSLISVIVPIYNAERYLERCIQSVLKQTYDQFELVLVDDGSIDKSGEICDWFSKMNNNVSVVHQKNKGVSAARNKGMSLSTGDWIMFLDADDWIEEDTLKKASEYFEYADIICFSFCEVSKKKTRIIGNSQNVVTLNQHDIEKIKLKIIDKNVSLDTSYQGMKVSVPWGKVIHRKLFEDNNLSFIEGLYGEDTIFNLYCFQAVDKIIYLDRPFYYYWQQEQSLYNGYRNNVFSDLGKMTREMEKFIIKFQLGINYFEAIEKRKVINLIYGVLKDYCNISNKKSYFSRRKDFFKDREMVYIDKASIKSCPMLEKFVVLLIRFRCFALLNFLCYFKELKFPALCNIFRK